MLPTQTQKRSKKPRGRQGMKQWTESDMACVQLLEQLQQDAAQVVQRRVNAAVKLQRALRRTTIFDKGFVVL